MQKLKNSYVTFFLVLASLNSVYAGTGEIRGFRLKTCGDANCVQIESPQAFAGQMTGGYASSKAEVIVTNKTTGKTETLNSKDFYYDYFSKMIYIRQLADNKTQDAVYDLTKEKLFYFPR